MGSQRNGGGGGCSLCRILNLCISLALLGGAGYVIWYFVGQPSGEDIKNAFGNIDFGDFSDVLENFTGFGSGIWDNDPYVGDNTTSAWRGTDGTGGLTLELWNALDENWQAEYAEAMKDWDNCNPNVLTLSSTQVAVDFSCTHANGVMKVCNGTFINTDIWSDNVNRSLFCFLLSLTINRKLRRHWLARNQRSFEDCLQQQN